MQLGRSSMARDCKPASHKGLPAVLSDAVEGTGHSQRQHGLGLEANVRRTRSPAVT